MSATDGDTCESPKRCLGCGYILEGLPENRCPECGRPFDPDDRQTYDPYGLAGNVFTQTATLAAWLTAPAAVLILLHAFAGAISSWLLALAVFFAFGGLSIAIVVVGATARRLLGYGRRPAEDWAALRRAFVVSLVTLIVWLVVLLLMMFSLP
ncbi:MAG: hypothetical protein KKB50_13455 [Planctomycetes bacterium]|nr:hypothetical protein [Planctomycetota bacterium]